jgi:bacterioferritin
VQFSNDPDSQGEKNMKDFVADMKVIRERARKDIEDGAITGNYQANRESVIKVLNDALATEIVCVLRYRRHYFTARGIHSKAIAEEFMTHSVEEQGHADKIAERISQLNGEPDLNPAGLNGRSHSEYKEGSDLISMIREDLIAERIAIESYTEIIRWLGEADPTSRRLIEKILEVEEEHAEELANLLTSLSST